MTDDKRLIEDYLPIQDISAEASREKSVRQGHISTIHLWWARRPLAACRAAVYSALVPASRFQPATGPLEKRNALARANAAKFVKALCVYPPLETAVREAERHILEAHAQRLSDDGRKKVTVAQILSGDAPRPKVLDMFSGGGAIPLEALRLGCEAYALDLNPVAHIIELCTLAYPQKYGRRDSNAHGCGLNGSWAGLPEEVKHWGGWVLRRLEQEIGDLYPMLPDPDYKGKRREKNAEFWKDNHKEGVPPGYVQPIAFLWTRTVTCKNPTCRASVPLLRQTWLCKRDSRCVALRMIAPNGKKQVTFEVVAEKSAERMGFDPDVGSSGGNAACPFCGTVCDSDYVKKEGCARRLGEQLMAIVSTRENETGKAYFSGNHYPMVTDLESVNRRIQTLVNRTGLTVPYEPIITDAKNSCWTPLYGLTTFGDLFTPRQVLCLLTFAAVVREATAEMKKLGYETGRAKALATYCGLLGSRLADWNSTISHWITVGEKVADTFARQAIPMCWDFSEINPFAKVSGNSHDSLERMVEALKCHPVEVEPHVERGTATRLPWPDSTMDAVVTDPPYYDNVPYSDLSDFFYVWLKRSIGELYPEHFAAKGAPKKGEAVADATRHAGSRDEARIFYEQTMGQAFREAHRVLKSAGLMVVVYAHKTTLGWATLVDGLRQAGFTVAEAWPLDTEKPGRLRAQESAALASSILLVSRKRENQDIGQYEESVRPELEEIVRERVTSLWELGISGADLVISCVGAGLRAFTRYASVEYANGEAVPAERFLTEVETVVLESILARLSREVGGNGGRRGLASVDPWTRFYTLWRYTYKSAELDAGEAIIFANGTHVELDGLHGLSYGARPLVEKKKSKYRLLDFTERGDDAKLGTSLDDGSSAPLIDALHRLLWLMERHPSGIPDFLREARPDTDQLRLVAQALAGPALKGGELDEVTTGTELAALTKLTANWRSVVEGAAEALEGPLFKAARQHK